MRCTTLTLPSRAALAATPPRAQCRALTAVRLRPPPTPAQALLATEALKDVPFLVLGNKMDVPGSAQEQELRMHLQLHETTGKGPSAGGRDAGVRPTELFMCSLLKKYGYKDGLLWLTQQLP